MEMMAHQDKQVEELRLSNDILSNGKALRGRMAEEGYVFLKGVTKSFKTLYATKASTALLI